MCEDALYDSLSGTGYTDFTDFVFKETVFFRVARASFRGCFGFIPASFRERNQNGFYLSVS